MRRGADGKDLPPDSLIQSTPKFKSASESKPVITQEHNCTIENVIELCVLGEDWGDAIPHGLPDVGSSRGEDEAP